MTSVLSRSRRRPILKIVALLGAVLLFWASYDLFAPRTAHLRDFNADEIARLDTDMWRSYYEKRRLRLFSQLSELLRTQYNMPLIRSNLVAYYAGHAAFVFKRGKGRADYELALPDLIKFYRAIRRMSDVPFDSDRAARLELEWWIVHREREKHSPEELARSLADLQAEIYQLPVERLLEHGRLRAEAMTIRDTKAAAGGVTEQDWVRIEELLRQSWRLLSEAVKQV
ncbi:MAG TPA: hypothetical protein VJ124_03920 [Pyrinomonadaceae bacterium]|nr:hypothetical protein [Pyrinomonadaceae bacterium]